MKPARRPPPELLRACPGLNGAQIARARTFFDSRPDLGVVSLAAHLVKRGELSFQAAAALLREADADRKAAAPAPDLSGCVVGGRRLLQRVSHDGASGLYAADAGAVQVFDASDHPAADVDRLRAFAASHPALAPVAETGDADGRPYVAFAGPAGRGLLDSPLGPPAAAHAAALAMARAVEALHAKGVRDLALTDRSFRWMPELKAIQIARLPRKSAEARSDALLAAGPWTTPEALLGEEATEASDVYALGLLFHAALTGAPPFVDESLRRLLGRPEPDALLKAGAPPEVAALVLRMLDPDPFTRPPAADKVVAPWASFAGLFSGNAKAPPPARPAPAPATRRARAAEVAKKPRSKTPLVAAGVAIAALAVLVLALARPNPSPPPPAVAVKPPEKAPEPPAPAPSEVDLLIEDAEAARRIGDSLKALELLRRAQRLDPRPELKDRILVLEEELRGLDRERKDLESVEKAAASLPEEAAIRACDAFLDRYPKSRHLETVLAWKADLIRKAAALKAAEPAVVKGEPPPAVVAPPPPAIPATRRPGLRVPGKPCRTLPPGIAEALSWLARHQHPTGAWESDQVGPQCVGAPCAEPSTAPFPTGLTALAALAFLGAGIGWTDHDSVDGHNLGEALRRALVRLAEQADGTGQMSRDADKSMYGQALAVHALAEGARSIPPDDVSPESARIRASLKFGTERLLRSQGRTGGWRYFAGSPDADASVTSCALIALDAASRAGEKIPETVIKMALAWLDGVTEASTGRVGYTHKGTGKVFVPGRNEKFDHHETLTAAAAVCRSLWAKTTTAPIALATRDLPQPSGNGVDFYYWYYGTRACREFAAPKPYAEWKDAALKALLVPQLKAAEPCARGSWTPNDRWGFEGGRIYATALNALTLEYAALPKPFSFIVASSAPRPPAPDIRWLILLKSGGQLRAVSYEEDGDRYVVRLAAGSTTIPKDAVLRIQNLPPPERKE